MQKILVVILLFVNLIIPRSERVFVSEKTEVQESIAEKQKRLDKIYSDKKLGSFLDNGNTVFRIFAPSAVKILLNVYHSPEDKNYNKFDMLKSDDGVWETTLDGDLNGSFYGYQVYHEGDDLSKDKVVCIDPYAKAVATYNTYMNPRLSIVYNKDYDWEGDEWIKQDWRDLIVYEMHIRDMTAHESSGSDYPGTYKGLIQKGKKGGIDYIKKLGVNTVELLPAQEFGNMEIPFKDSLSGKFNTWNPYERNHWGYMTAAYFAPEAYYSEDWDSLKRNNWMGTTGKQVEHFKDMVKAFHKEGIAVMMDVVYNHLSEYEIGNLKQIDKDYYFRLDENGNFIAESFCGNDLRTEAPMLRRLIIDSIIFWMKEYHIDGFRFDLGKLIDWTTIEMIIREAKKINPNVVFVCEPWGGGYDPKGFSLRGWGAWNDQIRNGVKGENPFNGHGWIFGKWYGNNSPQRIKSYVNGTLIKDEHGLFQTKEHSVNYLESHDGYTLGDFIRLGLGHVKKDEIIENVDEHVKLTDEQMKLNKLAAMFLFTSQGMTMIHTGQEYARSKVIPKDANQNDKHAGMIDHNTYDKDNEVNYINYDHVEINQELFDYYQGLIELRKKYSAFRHADYEDIEFIENLKSDFAFGYKLNYEDQKFVVLFNADQNNNITFNLSDGVYEILANEKGTGINSLGNAKSSIELTPASGIVLKRK